MPKLIDTTLREGEQTPNIHFSLAVKKRIFTGLTHANVDEIELGIATPTNLDLPKLSTYAHNHFPRQSVALWCRCHADDIRYAASLHPSVLSLSIPATDLHLQKKLGKDRSWALATVADSIGLARSLGVKRVALGLEDGSRADPSFLRELARVAQGAGAFRLRLADTVGIADPALIASLVEILAESGLEVAVHCHNDFGMATANTINAFNHGAKWGDVTLLGLGERAGNSRVEEVMAYLALQKGVAHYDLSALVAISRMLAAEIKRPIASNQPLLGADIFTCESGIHQQGILADPATYEPFAPERVGGKRKLVMGATSGRHGLAAALHALELARPGEHDLYLLWQAMRTKAGKLRRPLHDQELSELALAASS